MWDGTRRIEPSGITLADLMLLVLGCAIAFSMTKLGYMEPPRIPFSCFGNTPPPSRSEILIRQTTDFALQMELVLSLVALGRCWRWNRTPRAAEWLAILPAFWLLIWIDRRGGGGSDVEFIVGGLLDANLVKLGQIYSLYSDLARVIFGTQIGLACLGSIVPVRERLPARFKAILLMTAAFGLVAGPLSAMFGGICEITFLIEDRWDLHLDSNSTFWKLANILVKLLWGVTFGVALLATIRDRRDSLRWLDWPAILCLIPFLLGRLAVWLISPNSIVWSKWSSIAESSLGLAVLMALVIPLSPLAIRRLGPAWRRWTANGYHNRREAPTTPEA